MSLQDIWHVAAQLWVLWLVLLFVGIIVWVMLPRNRKRFRSDAEIPFRDDSEER